MTYQETISYLYERLPMFTRIGPAAYKKDLQNTIALLAPLGNPQKNFKTIHVAGTNGKGSTSHMLAAVFQSNGYKTGLYTSPHLKDFGERIKVSGPVPGYPGFTEDNPPGNGLCMISEPFVVDFVERVKPLFETIEPSFFELTVAMAFEYFSKEQVDIAIIETGLGGRLDSTNVITPELSIITNIGWDHMNLLGNRLETIAWEKAGIIKYQIPVVIGETLPETKPVFESKSLLEQAPVYFAEAFEITGTDLSIDHIVVTYNKQGKPYHFTTDLAGLYQQNNLRTVITAIDILKERGWNLIDEKTRYGLEHVKILTGLGGRWELVRKHPYIILDVGHNEDGIRQVLKQITVMRGQFGEVHIITGMVKDKEVQKVLQLFPKEYHYYFTNAQIPRAMPAIELQAIASAFGLEGKIFEEVNSAIDHALTVAEATDLLVVCGSVFVVGEVDIAHAQRELINH